MRLLGHGMKKARKRPLDGGMITDLRVLYPNLEIW